MFSNNLDIFVYLWYCRDMKISTLDKLKEMYWDYDYPASGDDISIYPANKISIISRKEPKDIADIWFLSPKVKIIYTGSNSPE